MLGGGTFVTQNKILPGAYINVVSAQKATAQLGERGRVAIALPLTAYTAGRVIEITNVEYLQTPDKFLGENIPKSSTEALDELFKHATRAFIYNSYSGSGAGGMITIELNGSTPTTGIIITGGTTTIAQMGALTAGTNALATDYNLKINGIDKDWSTNGSELVPKGAVIRLTGKNAGTMGNEVTVVFEGIGGAKSVTIVDGVGTITAPTVGAICLALEPHEFNIIAAYTGTEDDMDDYISQVKIWRDQYGKKCQLVVYNATNPDYEGVINIKTTVSDAGVPEYALVPWVAGAEAGSEVYESCTNMIYDGEYAVVTELSQTDLEDAIQNGEFVFHLSYGDVHVLEDINSLVTTTADKGDDFKMNQTMRVTDQIANDIAKLFNTKYLGKIQNNAAGRAGLWGDIVKHHRELENLGAIENFDSSLLTVEQGETKNSVVVHDVIIPVNAMSKLYMTVVVQ